MIELISIFYQTEKDAKKGVSKYKALFPDCFVKSTGRVFYICLKECGTMKEAERLLHDNLMKINCFIRVSAKKS